MPSRFPAKVCRLVELCDEATCIDHRVGQHICIILTHLLPGWHCFNDFKVPISFQHMERSKMVETSKEWDPACYWSFLCFPACSSQVLKHQVVSPTWKSWSVETKSALLSINAWRFRRQATPQRKQPDPPDKLDFRLHTTCWANGYVALTAQHLVCILVNIIAFPVRRMWSGSNCRSGPPRCVAWNHNFTPKTCTKWWSWVHNKTNVMRE